MERRIKLVRITTVPSSLRVLLRNQLKFMSSFYDVLAVSSPEKMLEEVAIHEEVRTASVAMTRSITPVKDLEALWKLYRLFRKEKPAIVHTHTPKAGLLGMMAGRLAGVPVRMHTVAGMPLMVSTGLKKKILRNVERLTYSCATSVYPNSKNLAEYISRNQFCEEKKVKVLGNGSTNGIDTDFFQNTPAITSSANELRKRFQFRNNDFVFLFIGRLVKDKGIEELVDAFTQLKQTHSGIKLLLVGPFEQELDPISQHTVALIEGDPDIIHEDFQQDIRPYLAVSNLLAFPSHREGFPNVPMQAGCFDLPLIVTDINGCNEIVEHGKNGLIIPMKDIAALRHAMLTLLTDQFLYSTLKQNARKMILERYDQKTLWNLLLEEYQYQLKKNEIV
jgi:glycosyltransferase involved in cell wall biosynthesis